MPETGRFERRPRDESLRAPVTSRPHALRVAVIVDSSLAELLPTVEDHRLRVARLAQASVGIPRDLRPGDAGLAPAGAGSAPDGPEQSPGQRQEASGTAPQRRSSRGVPAAAGDRLGA